MLLCSHGMVRSKAWWSTRAVGLREGAALVLLPPITLPVHSLTACPRSTFNPTRQYQHTRSYSLSSRSSPSQIGSPCCFKLISKNQILHWFSLIHDSYHTGVQTPVTYTSSTDSLGFDYCLQLLSTLLRNCTFFNFFDLFHFLYATC